jgi:hypothetical protein
LQEIFRTEVMDMSGLEESIKEEIPDDHLGKYFSPGNPKNLSP